jgi:hypothetical protein
MMTFAVKPLQRRHTHTKIMLQAEAFLHDTGVTISSRSLKKLCPAADAS